MDRNYKSCLKLRITSWKLYIHLKMVKKQKIYITFKIFY